MRRVMKLRWGFLVVMLAGSLGLFCGCESMDVSGPTVPGISAGEYANGELSSEEGVALDGAWQAAGAQIAEMQCNIEDRWKNEVNARILCHDPANNKIEINLMAAKEGTTIIRIRIDDQGDKIYSQEILSKIRKRF